MKTYIKKTLATTALVGVLVGSIAGVYAMSDEEFKKAILSQIQVEENLTDAEMIEVSEELSDISKEEILASLKNEISDLDNNELRSTLENDFKTLTGIQNGEGFFIAIDDIYESLDNYYEENFEDFDGEFDYNFEKEKQYIIESINEEKEYINDEALKAEIDTTIEQLIAASQEGDFFDILDALFDRIDEHYGFEYDDEDWDDEDWDNEYDIDDMKEDILEELREEKNYLDDEALKAEIDAAIESIKAESDEDVFFDTLDTLFDKLDAHYEENGIDVLDGEEFDFEEEREDILEDLRDEVSDLDEGKLKDTISATIVDLELLTSQDSFFDTLDNAYETLDMHYDEQWGKEDEDEEYNDEDYDNWEYDED